MTTDPATTGPAVLLDLYGKRFPVYFLADGTPAAMPDRGPCPTPVFITSVPKAGTYLTAEVLRRLGVHATNLHTDVGYVSDLRFRDPRKSMLQYAVPLPVEATLRLVAPGQFAVGHLPPDDRCLAALAGFRVLVVCRELRQAFISLVRFLATNDPLDADLARRLNDLPDGPARVLLALDSAVTRDWYLPLCRAMAGWLTQREALLVRFETLAGDDGPDAQEGLVCRIAEYLGLPTSREEGRAAGRESLNQPTLTFSGRRSSLDTYWNDAVEARFQVAGGPDINRLFGYPEPSARVSGKPSNQTGEAA
jgi:hypothetical protein